MIVEAANELAPLIAYLGALRARHPVILVQDGATNRDGRILETFAPYGVFGRNKSQQWSLKLNRNYYDYPVNEALSILLSTSGTTGSAKLVRLSRANIEENTKSIVAYLGLDAEQTVITTLPFHYSFGMSIINTHLASGGTILLTDQTISRPEFWRSFRTAKITCFYGVPFTFDLLEKTKFREHDYPDLQFIAQAGGRLAPDLVEQYSHWADEYDKRMFVMYGQTEASPRISYVPPEYLRENSGCIGVPIPGGHIELIDEKGDKISGIEECGELIYRGPNVMMGYAVDQIDLGKGHGENVLHTGDIACRNKNGMYRIVGRKSRFIKIYGRRVSLDEVEMYLINLNFSVIAVGNDDLLVVATLQPEVNERVLEALVSRYNFVANVIRILELDEFPLLPSGKIDSLSILRLARSETATVVEYDNLLLAYSDVLSTDDIRATDSFLSLGGDSLLFVTISIAIENYLGYLPDNWEALSIADLEKLASVGQDKSSGSPPLKKAWLTLSLIVALLVAGELFLQIRSYIKTGRSAFVLVTGESELIYNAEIGTNTYRPNLTVTSHQSVTMSVNSSGLRSPEIAPERQPHEIRIAVVGASTVAGTYAKSNDQTFPALLEAELRKRNGGSYPLNVINGGVQGNSLGATRKITEGLIFSMNPSIIIIYPGFNDITSLCNQGAENERQLEGLGYPELPNWVLSNDIIRKNTTALRTQETKKMGSFDVSSLDRFEYGERIESFVQRITAQGITAVLVTVSRAYVNVNVSRGQRAKLAETALYYYPCLNLSGIIEVGKIFNNQIRQIAKKRNLLLVDLENDMPGGREYFVDASHFTLKGAKFVATTLTDVLTSELLVD